MRGIIIPFAICVSLAVLTACNKDNEILSPEVPPAPVITFDNDTGVYTARTGREIIIAPRVENGDNAVYTWKIDGLTLSGEPVFTYVFNEEGEFFVELEVVNSGGSAREEIRVDVSPLAPPVISLVVPQEGVEVIRGRDYLFAPDVQNGEEALFEWTLNGETVGTEKDYTFNRTETGQYSLTLRAANEDGEDTKTFTVNVVDAIPINISFRAPTFAGDPYRRNVALGRSVFLTPAVENAADPGYEWSVNGETAPGATSRTFKFTPAAEGVYTVALTVTDRSVAAADHNKAVCTLTVTCWPKEDGRLRPGGGKAVWDKVYEYMPAPGQFINEPRSGFAGVTTMEGACAYAETRLEAATYVSLGGFGGYIIVGFDHSIKDEGKYQGYDFSVTGNQFAGSSEPGIVWVMQDVDGNGLPDDEWYELAGSETGKEGTIQDYAVTYYRPAAPGMDVKWTDDRGNAGYIDYMGNYHQQDYYYPLWVAADSYTLYGTRLEHRTTQDPSTGFWYNGEFDRGYADNFGQDRLSDDDNAAAGPCKTYFRIGNAIYPDGTAAGLKYIDFIKVQTALNVKAGWLGENSTEVFGFKDENFER